VNFVAITLCVASQRIIRKVGVYFIMDSVRKRLDTPSYSKYAVIFLSITILINLHSSIFLSFPCAVNDMGENPLSNAVSLLDLYHLCKYLTT
jgi:hypothetical protein